MGQRGPTHRRGAIGVQKFLLGSTSGPPWGLETKAMIISFRREKAWPLVASSGHSLTSYSTTDMFIQAAFGLVTLGMQSLAWNGL